ncbi:MAG: hypothetical protein KAT07_14315, partial [Calditrichia bacterium]|nr:hypothetical protein [Calditrichia bacterium]
VPRARFELTTYGLEVHRPTVDKMYAVSLICYPNPGQRLQSRVLPTMCKRSIYTKGENVITIA